ncbi:MAG: hypothetical protein FWH33_01290 [Oscillospiraceae bacterium]|nr:hypothetical protein [Oscillospiraceae bacterium]
MLRKQKYYSIRRKLAASLAICAIFTLAACAETKPPETDDTANEQIANQTIDFGNKNIAFLRSYEASPDAVKVELSITGTEETPPGMGALMAINNDGTMYIAADISSLLGDRVMELRAFEADIAVVNDHGDFYAVSGEIIALDAGGNTIAGGVWSVYLAEKNPNILRLEMPSAVPQGPYNMMILSKTVDNASAAGLSQSNLIIYEMRFYDKDGALLPVNIDAGFNAPAGFGEQDRSNLSALVGETAIEGARGSSAGWGQAVVLPTIKNGGSLDPSGLRNAIVTVYFSASTPPELILQSWTDGKPDSAGWAKVSPARVNGSGNIAQFDYADMVEAFGSDDFDAFLDQFYVGDTGSELKVYSVTVSTEIGGE